MQSVHFDLASETRAVRSALGISQAVALHGAREYRRFLALAAATREPLVPTKLVDAFWHAHMEAPARYAAACARLGMLPQPHDPTVRGVRMKRLFARTQEIYRAVFGEAPDVGIQLRKTEPAGSARLPASCARHWVAAK
jgi:hypothetical protein